MGSVTPPMIVVPAGRRHYWDADGNETVVYIVQSKEVLLSISAFQCASAYSDRLDARQFVLKNRLGGHEFLTSVGSRNMPLACSKFFRR